MAVALTFEPRLPFGTLEEGRGIPGLRRHVAQVPAFFGVGHTVRSSRGWFPSLPSGWDQYTHPGGVNYFHHPGTGILTPVDPRMRRNLERLQLAFRDIEPRLPRDAKGDNFHIVLGFTEEQFELQVVQYYLVDYNFRIIYWVHPVDVRGIGLQPYRDMTCLSSMLLPHFWTHVQHFPATARLDTEVATTNLIHTLRVGRLPGFNHLTPWDRDDCNLFLEALDKSLSGPLFYRTAILGRLNTILGKHRHSLFWDNNGNPLPFLLGGGVNDRVVLVPQRGPGVERAQPPALVSLLGSFFLLSACMVFEGIPTLSDGSADRVAFILTIMSSLLLCLLTTALNSLQDLDPRLLGVLVGRPWLSPCLVSLVSLNIGIYGLFLDGATRFLMSPDVDLGHDQSPNVDRGHDEAVKTALKVILPPMLITFTLAWRYSPPGLPPV